MADLSRYYTYLTPAIKSPKSQAYTTLILSLFAIAFFGVFAIRPTVVTILGLQNQINQANTNDKQLAQKIQSLVEAQTILDEVGNQTCLLDQALPQTPNVASLLRVFETAASQTNVTLSTVELKSVTLNGEESRNGQEATGSGCMPVQMATAGATTAASASAQPIPLSLTFSVTGDQTSINGFLHLLSIKRRLIVIDSLQISKDEKDNGYTANIAARAFQAAD